MGTRAKNESKAVFNYSEYLRDYYNRMAAGLEKVPSNSELALFMRQLVRVPVAGNFNKIDELEADHLEDVLPMKLIA